MPGPIHATVSTVHVDATTIDLVGEDLVAEFEPEWASTGLIAADPGGDSARILCGQEIGSIQVTAQLWDDIPPLPDDMDAWQDVAEVSAAWRTAWFDFGTTDSGDDPEKRLPLSGPGDYRMRVHGRHRDDGDPRPDDAPTEEYLIQLWPAPHGADRVIKTTSHTARLWRS
ncbi:hypothetical protein [Streptomyces sp. MZ04]|uniref:hypothetical protein n=1 Tax=Streptomyces sp. MZ04 TaxID=2559236 RepID=UPI00107E9EE5|nr:hypothetical protein [Streptomyces sp. MZ04]TGB16048.1 hypothetical protein E2651_00960 [Streptomyces sp. MZ04]